MSESQSIQRILAQAKEEEKRYDWLGAVEFHKKALGQMLKQEDFLKAGEAEERIGYCFHRAAFQAESQEEFRQGMQQAIGAYEKARGFYEKLKGEQKTGRAFRCKAVAKYLGYWITSDPSEKRKLLDDCLELEGKALEFFGEAGDMLEYGRTYNELPLVHFCRLFLEWNRKTLKSIAERGIEWGEKAVAALSELGDYETAKAYLTLSSWLNDHGDFFFAEPEQRERNRLKIVKYLSDANDIFEKVSDAHLLGLSHLFLIENTGGEESIRHSEKTLEYGERTRDNFLIAWGLDYLVFHTYWKAIATEDPEKRRELAGKAMQFYEKAQHHCSIILFMSPRIGFIGPPSGHAEHYWQLALWETDPKKRLELLEKSEKTGMKALKLAEDSDMPIVIANVLHVVSKTLEARARVEANPEEKRRLLEKALKHRGKTIEILEHLTPFFYWNLGVMQNYLAGIRAQLADIEPDLDTKRKLLEEAVSSKEKCLNLCNKTMPYLEKLGSITMFAALQGYQDTHATLLTQLYELTNKPELLRKAIEISQEAIESARKLHLVSLMAESYWKIAKAQDILGEHLKAAENFERASESYTEAAECARILQLKDFYHDYASYMGAWNQIGKAKHHHAKKQYGQAKEHYERAADLHKSTEHWNYLSPNYLAWAWLEDAEDLSRRGQTEEARDLFQKAAELFVEGKNSIGAKLEKIEVTEEKTMAAELIKAAGIRHEYCLGRIALEEAKILDRQGDHTASSKKYGSAAEMFQEIAKAEPEQSRKELQPIIFLCQAWQKMMMAEAKASSTMYGEAAGLFEKAKEYTLDQPTSLLALANSSFCKALEAGTEFEITRDMKMYSTAKRHLEAAENYYLKAGFKTASEYAKATYMLFDAYMYTHKAETETDPGKKAQYYKMAEKLLQTSAGSYMKAKHPEKSEEVQRLLANIKEKRQLAVSLTKVLHAPTITATTTSFSTPAPTYEKAVGLERFEHADIQTNLKASEEVTVEDEVEVRLDLVNVAKESGLLVRVDDLVPPNFKVIAPPSQYNIGDGSIDMKGRKLEPLKVETVKLRLQATETGVFNLSPQVIYVDELGKFSTRRPEPVAITVHPKLVFEFKTEVAQKVFSFLVSSFVEDYMRRRLSLEKAGWRTLMEIVKHGKVSKSSVYGARGRRGRGVSELERRGLVETRIFLGERGRGGKILKMRISYDKETIKRHIDQRIMKIKEK
jgi:tetratricopeptide (TPR) repeat protein